MTVRIGVNPLTWSNDDLPSLGAENSLETCLTEARAAGYAGVELGNKFPRDAAKLRPILKTHGLVGDPVTELRRLYRPTAMEHSLQEDFVRRLAVS